MAGSSVRRNAAGGGGEPLSASHICAQFSAIISAFQPQSRRAISRDLARFRLGLEGVSQVAHRREHEEVQPDRGEAGRVRAREVELCGDREGAARAERLGWAIAT